MDFLSAARKDDGDLNLIMRDYEIFSDKMGPAGKSALNIACWLVYNEGNVIELQK